MSATTRLNKREYTRIKLFTNHDIPIKEIHEMTGRSGVTIRRIKQSDCFEGYQELMRMSKSNKGGKTDQADVTKEAKHPEVQNEWQRWYDGMVIQIGKDASKARWELEQIHELLNFVVDQLK